jgi:hypothetical protein
MLIARGATTSRPMGLIRTPSSTRRESRARSITLSYVVRNADGLRTAAEILTGIGVKSECIERSPLWRHGPAMRFVNPSGHTIELTPGVVVGVPMAALVAEPHAGADLARPCRGARGRCRRRLRVRFSGHGTEGVRPHCRP